MLFLHPMFTGPYILHNMGGAKGVGRGAGATMPLALPQAAPPEEIMIVMKCPLVTIHMLHTQGNTYICDFVASIKNKKQANLRLPLNVQKLKKIQL